MAEREEEEDFVYDYLEAASPEDGSAHTLRLM